MIQTILNNAFIDCVFPKILLSPPYTHIDLLLDFYLSFHLFSSCLQSKSLLVETTYCIKDDLYLKILRALFYYLSFVIFLLLSLLLLSLLLLSLLLLSLLLLSLLLLSLLLLPFRIYLIKY